MSRKAASEKVGKPLPQCKAIVLCEDAVLEPRTRKWNLTGTLHDLNFPRLPAQTRPMMAYVHLVDGIGGYLISAEVWHLNSGESLAKGQGLTIEFKDRCGYIEFALPLPPLPMHHEGSFDVVVFANGQEITRRKFTVSCAAEDAN